MTDAFDTILTEINAMTAPTPAQLADLMSKADELHSKRVSALDSVMALANDMDFEHEAIAANLSSLAARASNLLNNLKRSFVDLVLIPKTETAMPSAAYPFIYAGKKCLGGDPAYNNIHLKQEMEWCDANPSRINFLTVFEVRGSYDQNAGTPKDIYGESVWNLLKINEWMDARITAKKVRDADRAEKKARQSALRAVNRLRIRMGDMPLPDPDHKKEAELIRSRERRVSDLRYKATSDYYINHFTAEELVEATSAWTRARIDYNLWRYGTCTSPDMVEVVEIAADETAANPLKANDLSFSF